MRPEDCSMAFDANLSILIVDDYKTMLRIIRNLLKQLSFTNVDEAADGSEASAELREKEYGLVISDWNMQPMTGLDLLREIRADATVHHLPFTMITAESKSQNVAVVKEAGVDNYIVKPFNAEALKVKITSVIAAA
jgi:two-component system chemotaxis response regulator CheY